MKLIDTRIRKEESESIINYFPEYCVEEKNWYGGVRRNWYGVGKNSTHGFGEAYRKVCLQKSIEKYSLQYAQIIIDLALDWDKEKDKFNNHQNTKKISYIKYP